MASIWITYAWTDNESGDVDFIAQELQHAGLTVKMDRWNLRAGVRLWEQIAEFIQSPQHCDAWLLIASQRSLGSEPCREEYAYALDRALKARGASFPVIALFPASVDQTLIPAGIRTRLHVSLRDLDWKERIKAAAENRDPDVSMPQIEPYLLEVHRPAPQSREVVVEVRPRAGVWAPFIAAIPALENEQVKLRIQQGPAGRLPDGGMLSGYRDGIAGEWAFCMAQNEATPTTSYYVFCATLPTKILFGVDGGTQFRVELNSASRPAKRL